MRLRRRNSRAGGGRRNLICALRRNRTSKRQPVTVLRLLRKAHKLVPAFPAQVVLACAFIFDKQTPPALSRVEFQFQPTASCRTPFAQFRFWGRVESDLS